MGKGLKELGGVSLGAMSGTLVATMFHRNALNGPLLASRALLGIIPTISSLAGVALATRFQPVTSQKKTKHRDTTAAFGGLACGAAIAIISAVYMNRKGLSISRMEAFVNFVASTLVPVVVAGKAGL